MPDSPHVIVQVPTVLFAVDIDADEVLGRIIAWAYTRSQGRNLTFAMLEDGSKVLLHRKHEDGFHVTDERAISITGLTDYTEAA